MSIAQYSLGGFYFRGQGVPKDVGLAVEWYKKAANQGFSPAQSDLGTAYFNGWGVKQDYDKALEWFSKSAKQGNAMAQSNIGTLYTSGFGVEQNDKTAVKWYLKAAEQGDANAQSNLGFMYIEGRGVEQNNLKAIEWYRKAAEQNLAHAQYSLGSAYFKGKGVKQNYVKAVEWFLKAAEQGVIKAQHDLGRIYQNGWGVEQNNLEAVQWYRKAAEQGFAKAQNALGFIYHQGKMVNRDYTKALEWFNKAAKQGHVTAQYSLGLMYINGHGVDKDSQLAAEWYRKAANQDYALAALNLGYLYWQGNHKIKKDRVQAISWYLKAAKLGNVQAQYTVGSAYEDGLEVEKDDQKAVEWYRVAAEQSDTKSQNALGLMYYFGQGVKKDYQKSMVWISKAAEQGYAEAQNNMGIMFAKGLSVEKDNQQAVIWYRKAATQGLSKAQNNLGFAYANGNGIKKDLDQAMVWYSKAAKQDNVDAMRNLGDLYTNESGVKKDLAQAFSWYLKAAKRGDAQAQYYVGYAYENAWGVEKKLDEAVEWYLKSAKQKYADSENALGNMYANGWGVTKNETKAVDFYRKAAEQNHAIGQLNLGNSYFNGNGIEKNDSTAFEWFEKASELGLAEAQFNLGLMYAKGWGVTKNETKAVDFYRKAADQGFANAQLNLGVLLFTGQGIKQDFVKARLWFKKAAENGIKLAKEKLVSFEVDRALLIAVKAFRNEQYNKALHHIDFVLLEVEKNYKGKPKALKLAEMLKFKASVLVLSKGPKFGLPFLRKALSILKQHHLDKSLEMAEIKYSICVQSLASMEKIESKYYCEDAVRIYEAHLPNEKLNYIESVLTSASLCTIGLIDCNFDLLNKRLHKALKIVLTDFPKNRDLMVDIRSNLEELNRSKGVGVNQKSAIQKEVLLSQYNTMITDENFNTILNIAFKFSSNNQETVAEGLFEKLLNFFKTTVKLRNYPAGHITFLKSRVYLGLAKSAFSRHSNDEAKEFIEESRMLFDQSTGFDLERTLHLVRMGNFYETISNYHQAEQLMDKAIKTLNEDQVGIFEYANFNMMLIKKEQQKFEEAEKYARKIITLSKKRRLVAFVQIPAFYNLVNLNLTMERYNQALQYLNQVNEHLKEISKFKTFPYQNYSFHHVELANSIFNHKPLNVSLANLGAFEAFQLSQGVKRIEAVSEMALKLAGDRVTKEKLIKQRDLRNRLAKLTTTINSQNSMVSGGPSFDQLAKVSDKVMAEVLQLDQELRKLLPAYDAIIDPTPLSIAETQSYLEEGEALLGYLIGESESYLFLIPKRQPPSLHKLKVSSKWLETEVGKIRKMLLVNGGNSLLQNFDLKIAQGLYLKLFEPIYHQLREAGVKRVVVVGDGALSSLPFNLLVKSLPSSNQFNDYSQADWLVKHFAFSRIPAIHALKLLRGEATKKHQKVAINPFIGFGDPLLSDEFTKHCQTKGVATSLSANAFYSTKSGQVDIQKLTQLCRLPNTATELQSMASYLNADESKVFVQGRATEHQIKDLSQSGELEKHKVVAFSTHGLLARDVEGIMGREAEPGLVFTPPLKATDDDNGLLTASEIALLDFNADWVVLSACNTATQEEGQEASGLSELSKSFFFAGARSILATHWNINSFTTELMLTDLFDRLSKKPDQPRAVALQQASISMIDRRAKPAEVECGVICQVGEWLVKAMNAIFRFLGLPQVKSQQDIPENIDTAHPYYWAPFMIIGEGGVLKTQ